MSANDGILQEQIQHARTQTCAHMHGHTRVHTCMGTYMRAHTHTSYTPLGSHSLLLFQLLPGDDAHKVS